MATFEHWSSSPEAAANLEQAYQAALEAYQASGATADRRAADLLAHDVRAARQYWREAGEALYETNPDDPGARDPHSLVKITEGA